MPLDARDGEKAIERVLLEQWDPLRVNDVPGPHHEYAAFVHDIHGLLLRGGSDLQVERHLRRLEREDLHRPELADRDLAPVVRALRAVERTL